jgi:hypothetical protein
MVEIPWNTYLATLVLILGLAMVSWGLSWGVNKVLRESLDPMIAQALVRSLRIELSWYRSRLALGYREPICSLSHLRLRRAL